MTAVALDIGESLQLVGIHILITLTAYIGRRGGAVSGSSTAKHPLVDDNGS